MNETIIDIDAENLSVKTDEQILTEIETLNNQVSDKDGGTWLHIEGHGICWKPNGDRMGNPLGVPSPSTPPPIIESIVKWGNQLDLDNIPYNSVVLIKLNVRDPYRTQMLQTAIAKQVLEPRIDKLKEKRVCVLFMESEDDISVMTEDDMNQSGWIKKDKNRIITL